MNLIVEFDLKDTLTRDEVAAFERFLQSKQLCTGTYMHGSFDVPVPEDLSASNLGSVLRAHSGRAAFNNDGGDADVLEGQVQRLFAALPNVTHFECQWEAPASM